MNSFRKIGAAIAMASLAATASAGILIDDFSVNQSVKDTEVATGTGGIANGSIFSTAVGQWSEATTGSSSILGGSRDLFVNRTGGGGDPATQGVSMSVFGGNLGYSTDSGSSGMGYIRWDGDTVGAGSTAVAATEGAFLSSLNATGLGGINFSSTASAFSITILESDLGFNFGLQVFTDATNWTLLLLQADEVLLGSPETRTISFSDFAGVAGENGTLLGSGALRFTGSGGSANLASVGALQAVINPFSGSVARIDLVIDSAETVPEPSALALVGLALLAAGAASRRKV